MRWAAREEGRVVLRDVFEMNSDELFEEFMQVNDFSRRGDFPHNRVLYTGFEYENLTKEGFMRTIDFAGFVDGRMGHRPMYEHGIPTGIPLDTIIEAGSMDEEQRKKILAAFRNMPAKRYEAQYALGRQQMMLAPRRRG